MSAGTTTSSTKNFAVKSCINSIASTKPTDILKVEFLFNGRIARLHYSMHQAYVPPARKITSFRPVLVGEMLKTQHGNFKASEPTLNIIFQVNGYKLLPYNSENLSNQQ